MDRNDLKEHPGDHTNAVLAAASYSFGLLLRYFAERLRLIIHAFVQSIPLKNRLGPILWGAARKEDCAKSGERRAARDIGDRTGVYPSGKIRNC